MARLKKAESSHFRPTVSISYVYRWEKYRDYANVPRNDPFPIIARIPLGFFVGPREIDMKSDPASR